MARGVKGSGKPRNVKTFAEQIEEIDAEINMLKEKLAETKNKKRVLLKSQKQFEMDEIQKLILKSGMSPESLKEMIEKSK